MYARYLNKCILTGQKSGYTESIGASAGLAKGDDMDASRDLLKATFEKQRARRWEISQTTAKERIEKLKRLREATWERRQELYDAIHADYRKNPAEIDITEIYPVLSEINHCIRHLAKWMKPVKVATPLLLFGTKGEYRHEAKGVVLILSPWNYPFNLLITPLIAAIAAGNCAFLKPSSKVPHTSRFLKKFISELFPEDEVALFEGSSAVSDTLLEMPFDHVFFTGSPPVGKKIMAAAAKNLAPVTLELGGKSPVIIDQTANIKAAAERVMWGKFINAGQTCVAPDYLLIHSSVADQFIAEARKIISRRFGDSSDHQKQSDSFCRIVSDDHLRTLKTILDETVQQGGKVAFGGVADPTQRYLSPTLVTDINDRSPIMREEIFGPILPVLTFESLDEAVTSIRSREKPLALYMFSRSNDAIEFILGNTTAGGTCVNSLIIHLGNDNLPFGGVGNSGMGNYHGYFGFVTFSHQRAVLRQGSLDLLRLFYPPYTSRIRSLISWAIRHFA